MSPRPGLHKYGPDPRCLRSFPQPIRERRTPVTDWVYAHKRLAGAIVGLLLTAVAFGVLR